jgi:hypothetical protein
MFRFDRWKRLGHVPRGGHAGEDSRNRDAPLLDAGLRQHLPVPGGEGGAGLEGLIFWHFENKETLFRTALQRTLEPYFINVAGDLEGLSEVDQIKRLIDEYYAFVSRNMYSVKFLMSLILARRRIPDDVVGT